MGTLLKFRNKNKEDAATLEADPSLWKLPSDNDRTSIVGKTGSGKTTAGLFILSQNKFYKKMPWIIIDYKGDDMIAKIPARVIRPDANPPTEPGLYKINASPFL